MHRHCRSVAWSVWAGLLLTTACGGPSGVAGDPPVADPAPTTITERGYGNLTVSVLLPASRSREIPPATAELTVSVTGPSQPPPQRFSMGDIQAGQARAQFVVVEGSGYTVFAEAKNAAGAVIASGSQADITAPSEGTANVTLVLRSDSELSVTLTASPSLAALGETVHFHAEVVGAIGGVVSYTWDLEGDGSQSRVGGADTTTAYLTGGQRSPRVSVVDGAGRSASASVSVLASEPSNPVLYVNPSSVELGGVSLGTEFSVVNRGTGVLSWTAQLLGAPSWCEIAEQRVDRPDGSGTIRVRVRREAMPVQREPYRASLEIRTTGGTSQRFVGALSATTPSLGLSVTALDYGAADTTRTVQVINVGSGDLSGWSATSNQAWVTIQPATGRQGDAPQVVVDRTGLAAGMHTAKVTFGSPFGSATLDVQASVRVAELTAWPAQLDLGQSGTTAAVQIGATFGTLPWEATAVMDRGTGWLSVTPASGTTPAVLTVSVSRSGQIAGTYTGKVVLTSNSQRLEVPVTVKVGGVSGGVNVGVR